MDGQFFITVKSDAPVWLRKEYEASALPVMASVLKDAVGAARSSEPFSGRITVKDIPALPLTTSTTDAPAEAAASTVPQSPVVEDSASPLAVHDETLEEDDSAYRITTDDGAKPAKIGSSMTSAGSALLTELKEKAARLEALHAREEQWKVCLFKVL